MPASTSFTVALVLTAVNSMSAVLTRSKSDITSYSNQVKQAADSVNKYDKQIQAAADSQKKYQELTQGGLKNIQSGLVWAAPVEEAVRQAANFEGVMKKVENALYDSTLPAAELQKQMAGLNKQALELGAATVFSNTEAAQAQMALIRNGMTYKDVLAGGAQAALYLAQTAEISTGTAADAVSQVTNMFQIQGSQLMTVADQINRAANASSAGVVNIMQDLQQAGMTAHTFGLTVKDTTLLLGTMHNMGLGESSGTFLNDMLVNLDKMTPKAQTALQQMGWLEGATVKYTKAGKMQVSGGTNSLFNEQGQIRSAEAMVQKLRSVLYGNGGINPQDLRDKAGNLLPDDQIEQLLQAKDKLKAIQQLKDVFGIQGMRAAIALATPGKGSYEEMVQQAERARSIQEQVLQWQGVLLGKLETLKGSWETLLTASGGPFSQELGKKVNGIINMVNALSDWANANPKVATSLLAVIAGIAAFKIGSGAVMSGLGTIGNMVTGTSTFLLRGAKAASGFSDTFKYFRQGAPMMQSLWQAAAFGNPTLTKIGLGIGKMGSGALSAGKSALTFGGNLLKLGAQALVSAAKMAAAWVIGLGPIGWIIIGVTAIIAAAVWAWSTNFLGFRDKVAAAWKWIQQTSGIVWNWMKANWLTVVLGMAGPVGWIALYIIQHWDQIKAGWATLTQALHQGWDAFVGGLQKSLDWIRDKFDALMNSPFVKWITAHVQSIHDAVTGTLSAAAHAAGGIFTSPHLGLVAEAGAEAIIPLRRTQNALDLYAKAGRYLGVQSALAMTGTDDYPPVLRGAATADNRTYIINIKSTDPKAAAAEVSKVIGGPKVLPLDKYQRSRDPRLQKFGLD